MIIYAEGFWFDNNIIAFRCANGEEEFWFDASDIGHGECEAMSYGNGSPNEPLGVRPIPEFLRDGENFNSLSPARDALWSQAGLRI